MLDIKINVVYILLYIFYSIEKLGLLLKTLLIKKKQKYWKLKIIYQHLIIMKNYY